MVLHLSSAGSDFSELFVSDTREDSLCNGDYDVEPAIRIKHRTFVSKTG